MIRLTDAVNGSAVYVSPELVTYISSADEWTRIDCNDHSLHYVSESPEEVVRKVLEWRLLTENRIYALNNGEKELASACRRMILKLAGLEEQA